MAPFRREAARSRRAGRIESRTRLLVVCGGESTEPTYFHGLIRARKAVHAKVKVKPKSLSPSGLVEYAQRLRAQAPDEFDEIWCVTDVDEFKDIPKALKAAEPHIKLAVSNPCFELWLLMHFEDVPAHCTGYGEAVRRLRRHLPQYDKKRLDYAAFASGLDDALRRTPTEGMLDQADTTRPFSAVGALVRRIVAG